MTAKLGANWQWPMSLCLVTLGFTLLGLDYLGVQRASAQIPPLYGLYLPDPCSFQPCCNGQVYDPDVQGCCNGVPYDLTTQDCCNGQTYFPATQTCCNGTSVCDNVTSCCCDGVNVSPCQ